MKMIVGIDEAGRGPLAGPVSVGVVCLLGGFRIPKKVQGVFLRDSKKLTEKGRELWFFEIEKWQREGKLKYVVSFGIASSIDKKGIVGTINLAVEKLIFRLKINPQNSKILLDGGLRAPSEFKNQKTIIKGDEKIPVISLASICAKVTRDKYMRKIAKKYPVYGFDVHNGYGTKMHYEKIKKFGLSNIHRRSFLKNFD